MLVFTITIICWLFVGLLGGMFCKSNRTNWAILIFMGFTPLIPVVAKMTVGAGLAYLGAALSTGLAALGAGIAVGAAAPAAIGACSEDPKAMGKALVFIALGESAALYGMLISIMIINNLS